MLGGYRQLDEMVIDDLPFLHLAAAGLVRRFVFVSLRSYRVGVRHLGHQPHRSR